ncbi:MAG TPA: hypothetical protein VNX65_02980 [Patescibacteria group bacterium]|nr:hypothetical protein [Patescibacteria group bacterium]
MKKRLVFMFIRRKAHNFWDWSPKTEKLAIAGLYFLLSLVLVEAAYIHISHNHLAETVNRLDTPNKQINDRIRAVELGLQDLKANQLTPVIAKDLNVVGQVKVGSSIVLTPTAEPSKPITGQLYFDKDSHALTYYDGVQFIDLGAIPATTDTTLQGGTSKGVMGSLILNGSLVLGDGLELVGSQLENSGVLSMQGFVGDVSFKAGPGIDITDLTIANKGILSIAGQTGAITLGDGLAVSGSQLSNSGVLDIGGFSGTIIIGNGLATTTEGQLFNSGVISLNSQVGALNLANSSAVGATVTIDDASVTNKGIAQFNSGNFSSAGGVINTVQDINISAKPTFGQLTLSSLNGANPMLLVNAVTGSAGNLLDLQVNAVSQFSISSAGNVTTIGNISTVGNVTAANLTATTGSVNITGTSSQYQINGSQISSAALSDGANLAQLSAPNTFIAAININGTSDTAQLVVKGNSQQSGDIFIVRSNGGANLMTVGPSGAGFQNSTNTTTAFRIQDTSGNSEFVVDTTNMAIKIGGGDVSPSSTPTLLVLSNKSTAGDPSGVAGARYYNTKSQTSRCYEGSRGWADCVGTPKPSNRPWAYIKYTGAIANGSSNTTFSNLGDQADTNGTGTKTAIATTATEPAQLDNATTAVSGNFTNIFGNTNYNSSTNPDFQTYVALTATTSERLWLGLTDQTSTTMAGAANPAGNYASFRYDTSAGDTTYKCITKAGVTQTIVDSGTAISTSGHKFEIILTSSQAEFKIDGNDVCLVATNIPAANILMRYNDSVTTLTSAIAHIRIAWAYIESDR